MRQEQIDKICTWAWGEPIFCSTVTGHKAWRDGDDTVLSTAFDPFTNPSDCARVMDEVAGKGKAFQSGYDPLTMHYWANVCGQHRGVALTESEAKMNAVLEAIQ